MIITRRNFLWSTAGVGLLGLAGCGGEGAGRRLGR